MPDSAVPTTDTTTELVTSPQTLAGLRRIYDLQKVHKEWLLYAALLAEHDIELFKYGSWEGERLPPDGACRSSQECGVYRLYEPEFTVPTIVEGRVWRSDDTRVNQKSPLLHPARDSTGRWLMLRIVRLGIEGAQHLDLLRFLSSYPNRADPRNHSLPMLRAIETPEISIAIFPFMMPDDGYVPGFFSLREVLDFVMQTMTGLAFLHENMVAHRDIAEENVVWNLAGPCQTPEERDRHFRTPWRSKFPIRYFFIDFEHAVQFPAGSDPSIRLVKGFPCQNFARFSPPEYLTGVPYCPFAADIFCLGLIYWENFREVLDPGFLPLVEQLLVPQPSMRPNATEALCAFHSYRESLSGLTLAQSVPTPKWQEGETHPSAIMPEPLAWSLGLRSESISS